MPIKLKRSLLAAVLVLTMSALAFAAYFQSFETDTAGWFGTLVRVPTTTHGVVTKTGVFHAEAPDNATPFTRWGGYGETFPVGGYTTSVDIYLDISPPSMTGSLMPYANDTRFDWSSAVNTPACVHRRDFVFNAGFYTDVDATGAGPRFVISASNNAGRGSSFPKNPDRMPYTVLMEGWYTFEHRFYALPPAPGGVLHVDLTLKNALGVPLMMWTLSDPSDIIGVTVGGNRYGWFVQNEFDAGLAFDTSALVGFQDFCVPPDSTPGAKVTGGGWIPVPDGTANFGLTASVRNDSTVRGNLTYHDHAEDRSVKSIAIASVVVTGQCAEIRGTAKVNGTGSVGFEVNVCDIAEQGKDSDTFMIEMGDGYIRSGTLGGGNIKIH